MDRIFDVDETQSDETGNIADDLVSAWNVQLRQQETDPNMVVNDTFRDPQINAAIIERMGVEAGYAWYENTTKFNNLVSGERDKRASGDVSGLFGENLDIPASVHADGGERRPENGYRINLDYLRNMGVDPEKVAMFRLTQPSETPKPEYYWTANYFEAKRGLERELSPIQRETAVVLVGNLQTISQNGGLIMDINDSGSLDVRQVGMASFSQVNALVTIKPN